MSEKSRQTVQRHQIDPTEVLEKLQSSDMAYLLRDVNGAARVIHVRHFIDLFHRTVWLELISTAGFEPLVVPFEHSSYSYTGHEVFLGLRPFADGRA